MQPWVDELRLMRARGFPPSSFAPGAGSPQECHRGGGEGRLPGEDQTLSPGQDGGAGEVERGIHASEGGGGDAAEVGKHGLIQA